MQDLDRPDITRQTPPSSAPSRWAVLLTGFALFLSGIGIGWLVSSELPTPVATGSAPTTTATTAPAPSTVPSGDGPAVTAPAPSEPATDPLLDGPVTDEPVADVAEALLPSVVSIEVSLGGVGSGVVYRPDGFILTAAHVVAGADEVTVRLADGERLAGTVIGSDVENDIAVVQVDRDNLVPAPLALDTPPRVGQLAIALGSPWGLDSTVTSGIVSAINQTVPDRTGTPRAMLQTDAPINPGNSGGPLTDRHGRVLGINVSIFTSSGASTGVGFAVPIDRAYRVAEALVEGGDFVPGFLGVGVESAADGRAGAVISTVQPESAAAESGLQVGDIVISVEGIGIAEPVDLAAQIRSHEAGDTVVLELIRGGEPFTLQIELGSR